MSLHPFEDRGWTIEAACLGLTTADYDPWHPTGEGGTGPGKGATVAYGAARRVCMQCPVRLECLHEGLRLLETVGVAGMWGGLTPEELRALAREVGKPARKVAQHGTRSRYVAGCHCALCTAANARVEHERRIEAVS